MKRKHLFVDQIQIKVMAGRGGAGASHFHREKFVPLGGPDGGDGGKGGDVIFMGEGGLKTLIDFSHQTEFHAENGRDGQSKKRTGRKGDDCLIKVPVGTLVIDKTNACIADIKDHAQRVVIAKGGRGGRGNVHFKNSIRQAPRLAEKGMPGEEKELTLELKLLAEVGIIGLPNAGKSSLLNMTTAARPKIGDYPFTTIIPNLGMVRLDEGASFTMVDIPGLIQGAAQGQGLGHDFLKHIERTKLFIHLIDIGFPGADPLADYTMIENELYSFNPRLKNKQKIIALNKIDLIDSDGLLQRWIKIFQAKGFEVFLISAATGQGVSELLKKCYQMLNEIPANQDAAWLPPTNTMRKNAAIVEPRFKLTYLEKNIWALEGREVEKWLAITDFNNPEAIDKLKNIFKRIGITEELKRRDVNIGDTIKVGRHQYIYEGEF